MKSDFFDWRSCSNKRAWRVALPAEIAERTGTIVGRSAYVNCARVLLDGNKSPTTISLNYLKEILSANAEVSAPRNNQRHPTHPPAAQTEPPTF